MIPDELFFTDKRFLSEIAIEFLCLKLGKIGFIDKLLTLYRMNNTGSYSGANYIKRLEL